MERRILRRKDQPGEARELDWINSEVRLLGKSFSAAVHSIEEEIARGSMIIVRVETAA